MPKGWRLKRFPCKGCGKKIVSSFREYCKKCERKMKNGPCNRCHGKKKVTLGKNRIPCPLCQRKRKNASRPARRALTKLLAKHKEKLPAKYELFGRKKAATLIRGLRKNPRCKRCKGKQRVKLGKHFVPCPVCMRKNRSSKKAQKFISSVIRTEIRAGYPAKQAAAIAYRKARKKGLIRNPGKLAQLKRAGYSAKYIDDYAHDWGITKQAAINKLFREQQKFDASQSDMFSGESLKEKARFDKRGQGGLFNRTKKNVEAGYMAGGHFHPIRSSRDYDFKRAGESDYFKRMMDRSERSYSASHRVKGGRYTSGEKRARAAGRRSLPLGGRYAEDFARRMYEARGPKHNPTHYVWIVTPAGKVYGPFWSNDPKNKERAQKYGGKIVKTLRGVSYGKNKRSKASRRKTSIRRFALKEIPKARKKRMIAKAVAMRTNPKYFLPSGVSLSLLKKAAKHFRLQWQSVAARPEFARQVVNDYLKATTRKNRSTGRKAYSRKRLSYKYGKKVRRRVQRIFTKKNANLFRSLRRQSRKRTIGQTASDYKYFPGRSRRKAKRLKVPKYLRSSSGRVQRLLKRLKGNPPKLKKIYDRILTIKTNVGTFKPIGKASIFGGAGSNKKLVIRGRLRFTGKNPATGIKTARVLAIQAKGRVSDTAKYNDRYQHKFGSRPLLKRVKGGIVIQGKRKLWTQEGR